MCREVVNYYVICKHEIVIVHIHCGRMENNERVRSLVCPDLHREDRDVHVLNNTCEDRPCWMADYRRYSASPKEIRDEWWNIWQDIAHGVADSNGWTLAPNEGMWEYHWKVRYPET
jgi:hypothetical protein